MICAYSFYLAQEVVGPIEIRNHSRKDKILYLFTRTCFYERLNTSLNKGMWEVHGKFVEAKQKK